MSKKLIKVFNVLTATTVITVLVATFLPLSNPKVHAATPPDSCFNFNSGTGTITAYYDYEDDDNQKPACTKDVNIPSTIDGTEVIAIGNTAFRNRQLISITIPNSVITIGEGAFEVNTSLTSVTIGSSVTTIGEGAFFRNNLSSVVIPNSVTIIDDTAFWGNSLTTITIPNSVVTIGEGTFACNQLTNVTIGSSVTTIGDFAFAYNNLTTVTIPNSVTNIGLGAFTANGPYSKNWYDMLVEAYENEDIAQIQQLYNAIRLVKLYTADPTNPNNLTGDVFTEAMFFGQDINNNGNQDDILGGHLINPPDEEEEGLPPNQSLISNTENNASILIEAPDGATLTCSSASSESSNTVQDSGFNYPIGLVNFCFDTNQTDNQVSLTFVTDKLPNQVVARKYNPTTNAYFTIPHASITETTYNNQPALQLTYTITDNGDLDLNPNTGQITDPVGLAEQTTGAANTGVGRYWLLRLR